jgi:hypothetical protein
MKLLALFHRVPVDMFPFIVPMYFHDEYFIVLQPGRYFSEAVFVKK